MHKLLEKLDKELHKYADKEGELKPEEWECVYKAIRGRKELLTSMAMEGEDQYGNYDEGRSAYSGRFYPMMDPDMTYSYRGRGRSGNGNFRSTTTSSMNGMNNGGRISRRSGNYSGNGSRDMMLDNLYEAMEMAQSEDERKNIQNLINKLEY